MFGIKKSTPPPVASQSSKSGTVDKVPTASGPPPSKNTAETQDTDNERKRATAVARVSVAFAQIVSVLMRSPQHKHFSLADLEWLVIPPLLAGHIRVAEARKQPQEPGVPIGLALWASVAPEVDKRLTANLNAPVRLRPDEWKSGDILWLIEVVGNGRVVAPILKDLAEKTFKGKPVKMRIRGEGGKPEIRLLADVIAQK